MTMPMSANGGNGNSAHGDNGFAVGFGGGGGQGGVPWRGPVTYTAPEPSFSFTHFNDDGTWETRELRRKGPIIVAEGFSKAAYVGDDEKATAVHYGTLEASIRSYRNRLNFLVAAKNMFDADIAKHKADARKAAEDKRATELAELRTTFYNLWRKESGFGPEAFSTIAEHVHKLVETKKSIEEGPAL